MGRSVVTQISGFFSTRKGRKLGYWLLCGLGAIVVFCTTYILILPAITMSNDPICGEEAHTHNESCWTSAEGQLVCGETLKADKVVHKHSALCYNSNHKLVCPLKELEAHMHGASCYEEARTLICGEEEAEAAGPAKVLVPGHTHGASCYEVKDERTCGQAETSGHSHGDSCYSVDEETGEATLTCGEAEAPAHTHDESCYTQKEVLACGEEEREDAWVEESNASTETLSGHVHTDECYEVTEELACGKEEVEPHEHDEYCYDITVEASELDGLDEDALNERVAGLKGELVYDWRGELVGWGVLTCDLPVVIEHEHDDGCLLEGSEDLALLTCGKAEHIHTDDCYIPLGPDPDPHRCGLAEHTHSEDCYFESGELRCTIPEHTHTEECLDADNFEKPKYNYGFDEPYGQYLDENGEPVLDEDGNVIWVDQNGNVVETDEEGNPILDEDGNPVLKTDEDGNPVSMAKTITFDDYTYEFETEDFDVTLHINGVATLTETEAVADDEAAPADDDAEADGTAADIPEADASEITDYTEEENGEGQAEGYTANDVDFRLDTLDTSVNEEARALLDQAQELAGEDSNQLMLQVVQLNAHVNGQELDLTPCEVTVEMKPKAALVEQLTMKAQAQAAEDLGSEAGEEVPVTAVAFTLFNSEGVQASESVGIEENAASPTFLASDIPVLRYTKTEGSSNYPIATMALDNRGPKFTVQYYAKLDKIVRLPASDPDQKSSLNLLNTDTGVTDGSGGKLPVNGITNLDSISIDLNPDSTVKSAEKEVELYKSREFYYSEAPNLNYFNIFDSFTGKNTNYEPVMVIIGSTDTGDEEWEEIVQDGDFYLYKDFVDGKFHFTNRPETNKIDPSYILITETTVIRLVCEETSGEETYATNFHDYDVSNGNHKVENGVTTMYVDAYGINSESNYSGSGAKLAFGNGPSSGGGKWSEDKFSGYYINQANTSSYVKCMFGLAKETTTNGQIAFSDGVVAPNLFLGGTKPAGRYDYSGSLTFSRLGDTYTLSRADVGGKTSDNLGKFYNYGLGWKQTRYMWANNFWPMDNIKNKDIFIGDLTAYNKKAQKYVSSKASNGTYSNSDDGRDHNTYFGMDFAVDFEVTDDYLGPLEYYFFGDDDMWIYLTDKSTGSSDLVCDIGGVHQAAGEYVNLWNWLPQGKEGKYRLNFYYTERGAYGSTCWMQFTLPSASVATTTQKTSGLTVKKEVKNAYGDVVIPENNPEFSFKIYLWRVDELGNKQPLMDDYNYVRYDAKNNKVDNSVLLERDVVFDGATFKLKANERIEIQHLPEGTHYSIVEERADGYNEPLYDGELQPGELKDFVLGADGKVFTVTNVLGYKLPKTGGIEALLYTTGVTMLFLAACGLLYSKKQRRKGACQ